MTSVALGISAPSLIRPTAVFCCGAQPLTRWLHAVAPPLMAPLQACAPATLCGETAGGLRARHCAPRLALRSRRASCTLVCGGRALGRCHCCDLSGRDERHARPQHQRRAHGPIPWARLTSARGRVVGQHECTPRVQGWVPAQILQAPPQPTLRARGPASARGMIIVCQRPPACPGLPRAWRIQVLLATPIVGRTSP